MHGRAALMIGCLMGFLGLAGCQSHGLHCHDGTCHGGGWPPHQAMVGSIPSGGCDSCGLSGCTDCGHGGMARGPFDHLRKLGVGAICGNGCGEIYWGEWISDPPDCCDPCGPYGLWTGNRMSCPPKRGLPALWNVLRGHRYTDGVACTTGAPGMMEYYPTPASGNEAAPPELPPAPGPEESADARVRRPQKIRRVSAEAPVAAETPSKAVRAAKAEPKQLSPRTRRSAKPVSQAKAKSARQTQAVGTGVDRSGYYRR